jgi:O-antigen biosynthesis protein
MEHRKDRRVRSPTSGAGRPIVSVIIPTFNRAHLLSRAVGSVLRQTFPFWELILVDDGSTDDTPEIVQQCEDPRIHYVRLLVNQGVSAARNRGMREARGEFIAFLDSDDEWMDEKLRLQVQLFRSAPEDVGLTYTGVENVYGNGDRQIHEPTARGDLYADLLLRNVLHGGGSGVMIRRTVVDAVGQFDEALPAIEDYDYWLRIARQFRIDFVPDPLVRYHQSVGAEPRKSMEADNNLRARESFYQKNEQAMRRVGVAHEFLLESARRHKWPEAPNMSGARAMAVRAALQRPLWWAPYSFLLGTLPKPVLSVLRKGRQVLQQMSRLFRTEGARKH